MFHIGFVEGVGQAGRGFLPWRGVAILAAILFFQPVRAEINLLDQGVEGIALSNDMDLEKPLAESELLPVHGAAISASEPQVRRQQKINSTFRRQWGAAVRTAAARHGLPEDLLLAVIEVESNFNAAAVSPKGAVGLMQLMPQTARNLDVADVRDPVANINGGARYLKELLGRFGNNLHLALAAYNAGPRNVERVGAIPSYAETQRYVPLVISRYHNLQSGFPVLP